METAQREMPRYQSHKKVWALKIKTIERIDSLNIRITPEEEDYAPFDASIDRRPQPEVGWYFVQYENGYHSFSPSPEFEEGYTRI